MGIELDTTGLIHLFEGYGYLALGALLLLAAAGAPLPWPIAASFVVFGALTAHPSGPSFLALALVATSGCDHRTQPPLLAGAEQQPQVAAMAAAPRTSPPSWSHSAARGARNRSEREPAHLHHPLSPDALGWPGKPAGGSGACRSPALPGMGAGGHGAVFLRVSRAWAVAGSCAATRHTQSCPLLRHHRGGDRPAVPAAVAACWHAPPCEPSRVTRHGSDGI